VRLLNIVRLHFGEVESNLPWRIQVNPASRPAEQDEKRGRSLSFRYKTYSTLLTLPLVKVTFMSL
jgi:hypothetical protein